MTSTADDTPDADGPVPLLEPAGGVPPVIETQASLAEAAAALAAGSGPVAVDAERASGYRYGQRAYLIQMRRSGGGILLVDPIACGDLTPLIKAVSGLEWVLHAASQDIPCLAEVGLRPERIFDTELAGRLLGYPRVGLGSMVEIVLGLTLEKGHSAVDWSVRPLPEPWLRYAALDVEVLVDLRDALEAELKAAGKLEWAHQEFSSIVANPLPGPRTDPWRRVSGLHRVRRARQLAVVRSLWETRDRMAAARDIAPGRILPDSAIVEAALTMPTTVEQLAAMAVFGGRSTRRAAGTWFAAIEAARALPEDELPPAHLPASGPPPPRSWAERDPAAAARLAALRAGVAAVADANQLPTENLLAPDQLRRIAWTPPDEVTVAGIQDILVGFGARPWQIELTAEVIVAGLAAAAAATAGDTAGESADESADGSADEPEDDEVSVE
ncbi:MAG TPA: ribonuclease D [Sporichthya sp.]|nr:ribonuclease D [Sporichthya sp.]